MVRLLPAGISSLRYSLLFVSLFFGLSTLAAQDFRITTNNLVSSCTGNFVDGGGQSGAHTVGTTESITICSDSPAPNSHIRISFTTFEITGTLTVYNSDNSSDPADIITIYDNTANTTFPIVSATAGNISGCLTFVFEGTAANEGWVGAISCVQACQPVIATLFSTDPEIMPVDTGYMDVCLGDTVTFVGGGTYPENGLIYAQDDATSVLEWNFTDGYEIDNDQAIVRRVFNEPGGYLVNLKVTDVIGCESTNLFRQRIRVAPRPTFNLQTDFISEVCSSDTIVLAASTEINPNPGSEIFVTSDSVNFPVSLAFADTTFLPDDGMGSYATSLEFTNFDPGATLTNLNDLIGICINMEHSFAGDLDMFIECPNGSTANFINFGTGLGGTYLGEPIDVDADLSPGVGYDYCFIPDPALLSIAEFNNTNNPATMPAGDYNAVDDAEWNNLLGCPLNGDWTINIMDNLFSDNGYIFSWSIEFASYLYPNAESFRVGIEDFYWVQQDNMIFYDPDSIRALATFSGINSYSYEVVDSFGCVYDTTLNITVNPFSSPDCHTCQEILDTTEQNATLCGGSSLQTNLATATSLDTLIPWAAFPYDSFRNAEYSSLSTSFNSVITVNNIRPLNIADVNLTLASVCVDIETDAAGDIRLFLQSPAGSLLELSTGNGGADPNYTNTCFTPTAATPITAGTAPFTGDFLPEANFDFLNGSAINGNWTLRAYDVAGGSAYGEFRSWSITFRHENEITYTWTPNDGTLSCTDCPDPVITTSSDQTYNVTATDFYGCSETGVVNVMLGDLPADIMVDVTQPVCGGSSGDASATVDVDPMAGFSFAWSHGPTTQTVTNLDPGMYTVTISAGSCETTRDITINEVVPISVSLDNVVDLSCNGSSDGEINVQTSGGTGTLTYAWDDPNLQVLEDAVFLNAGTFTLTVTDENGCMETITATVNEPDPLTVAFTTDDVNCNGGNDGLATVTPDGGNGGYQFNWETGGNEATINNIMAGNYSVTITDSEGCQIVDSVSVAEPAAAVSLVINQDVMGCAGASLNQATVNAMGGQPPYVYSWPNGAATPTATDLSAGLNTVTVTDGSGCETTIDITLQDLQPISFNLFSTDPSCNGSSDGAMGVNQLTGGAGSVDSDYTFAWSSGSSDIVANNLVGGVEYSLTVTDQQGCSATASRFLDQPASVELVTDENSVSCFGFDDGSISIVTITGPNDGDYSIQWDAAAGNSTDSIVSGLGAGVYNVEITDSEGCVATRTVSLIEPTQLELDIDKVDVTCFGDVDGSISTIVAGGTPGYTFNWSTGSDLDNLTDLSAGAYELVLNDANGCEEVREINIVQPPEVIARATAEDVICNGDATGRIFIDGAGGRPPFTYGLDGTGFSQQGQFIGLPANTYTVYVRDIGGCLGTTEVTVEDGPVFEIDLGEDRQIIFGDSIELDTDIAGAVGDLNFFWEGSYDGTLVCPGDSLDRTENTVVNCASPNAKPEYEIDYVLRLIDGNGCEAEDRLRVRVEKIRVVEVPLGFTPNSDNQNDRLIVHGRPGTIIKRFSVFDRWGEVVYEKADFPVNDFSSGWNGFYKDELLNGGTFVWQVEALYEDGSTELLTGRTTLLR